MIEKKEEGRFLTLGINEALPWIPTHLAIVCGFGLDPA